MPSVTYIVFGITSDLSRTKLIPSAYQLWRDKKINQFVGVGRKPLTEQEFHNLLVESLLDISVDDKTSFIAASRYHRLNFNDLANYKTFRQSLSDDALWVMHLALPPDLFLPTLRQMHTARLSASNVSESHIMVEKPFGSDFESASTLIDEINRFFSESQIYRVDHYLGKSTVRDILPLRSDWEALWNQDYIQSIQIVAAESEGIHNRGNYYDKTGAIRDMVQSHCLELLALLAMELPKDNESESLRQARVDLLKEIKITKVMTGQYKGYRKELHVDPNSSTETYTRLQARIARQRWQATKFEITTGKKMGEKKSAILIKFKPETKVIPRKLLPPKFEHIMYHGASKMLEINIDFHDDAYINLVTDCIVGDHSFFVRNDEVLAAWKAIKPALNYAANIRPEEYEAGSQENERIIKG